MERIGNVDVAWNLAVVEVSILPWGDMRGKCGPDFGRTGMQYLSDYKQMHHSEHLIK